MHQTKDKTWTPEAIHALFDLPFNDLIFQAQSVHREHFDPNAVQASTLLSIKTGACPEDCKYCPQSVHYNTGLEREKLLDTEKVIEAAQRAKDTGATRFCMGAGWRAPPTETAFAKTLDMVKAVRNLGLETCMTMGMLNDEQAERLAEAGLDYYNHNLDTSPEFYGKIITTRTYEDRLKTLKSVADSGMNVCCGGILGMGESRDDRVSMLMQLDSLEQTPQSIPINQLVRVKGTPMENAEDLDPLEFVRMLAVTRIIFSTSYVRLSAGREQMDESLQTLCFLAGANSIFFGEKLLTTPNPEQNQDLKLLKRLGMHLESETCHANA